MGARLAMEFKGIVLLAVFTASGAFAQQSGSISTNIGTVQKGTKAQQSKEPDAWKPLHGGHLTVWLVRPDRPPTALRVQGLPDFTPMTYKEDTASNFGKTASNYGTSAGNYGVDAGSAKISRVDPNLSSADADEQAAAKAGFHEQEAGSFGQSSSDVGNVSSEHGQTAGSLGQTASTYGTNAGNYGQPASTLGHSVDTIANAGQVQTKPQPVPFASQLEATLATRFPDLKVSYVQIDSNDVRTRLRGTGGKDTYPDVLVLDGFATSWPGFPQEVRDALGANSALPRAPQQGDQLPTQWYETAHATHPITTRALMVYLEAVAPQMAPR
jgi:hypothetical protein